MSWLSGKPLRTRTLTWPAADADLAARYGTIGRREGSAVVDGLIVYWIALLVGGGGGGWRTVVYAADTTRAEEGTDEVGFERVAELDYAVYRLAVVPQVGFAAVEWITQENAVKFRSHSLTGSILHECSVPVRAAYGDLSLFGSTVSLCVSSGNPAPDGYEGSDIHFHRLDYLAGYTNDLPLDLIADEILTWDAASGNLRRIRIPFDSDAPMTHWADFQYISTDKIALAAYLDEPQSGLLKCFSTEDEEAEVLTFSHGDHTNPENIERAIGRPGSTDASQITVHFHDGENRITVFKRDLLLGNIPSVPTSDDPEGLRMVFHLHEDSRTLPLSLANALPSVSGDRVLVKNDKGIGEQPALYILDFDQERLAALATAGPTERAALRGSLRADGARVKVVTRRFHVNVLGEVDDKEYPWPGVCPQAWSAHLHELLNRRDPEEGDDDDGGDDGDVALAGDALEFDEAPEEHRVPTPFGYVQTRLRLGGVVNARKVAITKCAVVEMPEPGKDGRVFYFE